MSIALSTDGVTQRGAASEYFNNGTESQVVLSSFKGLSNGFAVNLSGEVPMAVSTWLWN